MSDLSSRYRLTSQDIVCEEFDGEMVILNLSSGHYFALNRSASVLMNGLVQGHAPEELCAVYSATLAPTDVREFFRKLLDHDLVTADSSQSSTPLNAEAVHPGLLTEPPSLEIHDDLADLIIADPIHDTDETVGWPAPKAA